MNCSSHNKRPQLSTRLDSTHTRTPLSTCSRPLCAFYHWAINTAMEFLTLDITHLRRLQWPIITRGNLILTVIYNIDHLTLVLNHHLIEKAYFSFIRPSGWTPMSYTYTYRQFTGPQFPNLGGQEDTSLIWTQSDANSFWTASWTTGMYCSLYFYFHKY